MESLFGFFLVSFESLLSLFGLLSHFCVSFEFLLLLFSSFLNWLKPGFGFRQIYGKLGLCINGRYAKGRIDVTRSELEPSNTSNGSVASILLASNDA